MTVINPLVVSGVKLASNFLVSSGVSTIVGYAAKTAIPKVAPPVIRYLPVGAKTATKIFHGWQKFAIPAGATALAGMAADKAVKYAEEQIDLNVMTAEKYIAKVQEAVNTANKTNEDKADPAK